MPTTEAEAQVRLRDIPRTAAQTRVLTAALELFTEYGVSGTSLQMMADHMGVTKAAVYHQFRTKEEIVIAVTEVELAPMEEALERAEATGRGAGRDVLLNWVIDIAVRRRKAMATLQTDPVIVRLLAEHEPFIQLIDRLYAVLIGTNTGPEARVPAAMLSAAIAGAVMHPLVADLDDDTLRTQLLRLTRRLLDVPDERPAKPRKRAK